MRDPAAMVQILSLLLVFAVLYFLMLRPQSKLRKEREAMLKSVGKGARILTSSGFYGTVVATKGDDVVILKLADNVRVEMNRSAVQTVLGTAADAEGA